MFCLSQPVEASEGYLAGGKALEACQSSPVPVSPVYSTLREEVLSSAPTPAPVFEQLSQQSTPPITTASIHEARLNLPGRYAEGVAFVEPGVWRFRKRAMDLEDALAPDELLAEAPEVKAAILPEVDFVMPSYMPPDITRGAASGMEVAVTFDGGSEDSDAGVILKELRERGIRTTIFLTGEFIRRYPALVRQMVADGHEIGNHTMTHPHLTDYERTYRHTTLKGVDRAALARELRDAALLFKAVAGVEMAPLWRAPYGEVNAEIRRWGFEEGYVHVGWTYDSARRESLDTLDWVDDVSSRLYRTSYEIRDRVLNFGKGAQGVGGGIVLMHLGTSRKTDKASSILGEMLDGLSERGYRAVKVSELIEGDKTLRDVRVIRRERLMRGMVRLGNSVNAPDSALAVKAAR